MWKNYPAVSHWFLHKVFPGRITVAFPLGMITYKLDQSSIMQHAVLSNDFAYAQVAHKIKSQTTFV